VAVGLVVAASAAQAGRLRWLARAVPAVSDARRRRPRRSRAVAGAAVLIVVAGGGTAWGLTRGSGDSFRTATADHGTVTQTLSSTGTVSAVSHADESFQVAGTVAHVAVKAGQKVHAGQVLAHLDRSDLRAELRSARSTLASARNGISNAESGQSDGTRGSTQSFEAAKPTVVRPSSPPGGSGTGTRTGTGSGSSGSGGSLSDLQSAVRVAQQATDQDLSIAGAALKNADAACSPAASTPPTAAPTTGATPDPTPTSSSSNSACTAYSSVLLSDQQDVSSDEQRLATAEAALNKAVDALLSSANRASSSSSASTPSRSSSSEGGSTASAADIALDQANIDQAKATVAADEADLAQATLRATIAGHVAAVTIAHGDQIATSASEPAVEIVGSHQEQVTIDLAAADIRHVKAGMTAHVVADGLARSLIGHVVSVDSAGVESSSGTISYPVTVALPTGTDVVGGAAAAVTVVVATVDDVLAVPTSAVHYSGTTAYVDLLRGGKEARRTVKVGAVGATLTEITSGLTDGQQVVLADLGAAVPSSSSTLTRGGGFGVGGFGGGGFGGAGGGAGFTRRFTGGAAGATTSGAPPG
jgi:multidrug efflux pump subunit AcrA (membrane-fusion protein)